MTTTLESLLVRIRDGAAVTGDAERALELVRADARLPEDLRGLRRVRGSDAAGLLAVLGEDDLELAAAIAAEAGEIAVSVDDGWEPIGRALREGLADAARDVDVADGVIRRLGAGGFPWGAVLADAVEAEAGRVALADDVVDEPGFPVADALRAEAGDVDVAGDVMAALGLFAAPIGEAVRAEAGDVSVADAVMREVRPRVVADAGAAPKPANDPAFRGVRRWGMGLVALAAAALVAIVVGRLSGPTTGLVEEHPLLFAQAGDVVVEDLRYGDDVQVFQIEGEQGAVILWVDEGA